MTVIKPDVKVTPSGSAAQRPTSFLSDEKGNLKFVNAAVRYPCVMLGAVISTCIFMTAIFGIELSQLGTSIFSQSREYDAFDIRSIRSDTVSAAIASVARARDNAETSEVVVRTLEEIADFTYWIYEAEKGSGLLTKDNIEMMRAAENMFASHEHAADWCLTEYEEPGPEAVGVCSKPRSMLNIYYASAWDSPAASAVIAALKEDGALARFNSVSFCAEYFMGCDMLTEEQVANDVPWAYGISQQISAVTDTWDGVGTLTEDVDGVTEFVAYMNLLLTRAHLVNFYLDNDFSLDNLQTKFTRSITLWGGPLPGYETMSDQPDKQGDLRKDHIMTEFYDEMTVLSDYEHSDDMNAYYFMGALIEDVFISILLRDMVSSPFRGRVARPPHHVSPRPH